MQTTQVTETGTWSRVKAKWSILPRPRRCFLWHGQSLWSSQGPGVTSGGTSSVSCVEAWAPTPVANSPDPAILPALTPLSATCLLWAPPFQLSYQGVFLATSGPGGPEKGEQEEQWEALSLGSSGRGPSAFNFTFRSRHRPTPA